MKPKRIHMMLLLVTAVSVGLLFQTGSAVATTITILNLDGANEGFNDPTPLTPVGGNPATTLGQARLNAFQYAADLWAERLQSNVTIFVEANMDPLFCSPTQAILGGAGANTVHGNFTNAPVPNTWYPQALANSLAGFDLHGSGDLGATFNSNIDGSPSCLSGASWYYGFDANPPPGDIDFVTVVLHEIGHGLGFQTFVGLSTGAKLQGFNDTYMLNLEHHGANPPLYPNMTDAQRVDASQADPDLHWVGVRVTDEGLATLTGGVSNGHVRMHGPSPQQSGSSVSHWSTALSPNQLMEPSYTGPNHDVALALPLMEDIGWALIPTCPAGPEATNTDTMTVSNAVPLWTIRVEVSNLGPGTAKNVQATMIETLSWLTVPDSVCAYGDIPDGGSSFGGSDSYTLDLTGFPGGEFDVDLKVTWEDTCGNVYQDTVPQTLLPPPTPTGIPDGTDVVSHYLEQNYPNPFNPKTEISYHIPQDEAVSLNVYDVSGRLVRTLVDGNKVFGPHSVVWDGKDNVGRQVSSGVYFYRLWAGDFVKTRRMVLLK
jgi:hypothetical protein